jgi:hypothetical protein
MHLAVLHMICILTTVETTSHLADGVVQPFCFSSSRLSDNAPCIHEPPAFLCY